MSDSTWTCIDFSEEIYSGPVLTVRPVYYWLDPRQPGFDIRDYKI
jgi:hypothetical protein